MIFARIKQSCYQPKHPSYKNYGGRGIKIAPEWLASGTSQEFVAWALANGYTRDQELEIDRLDNDGDYAPSNCAFVTPTANARNRSTNWYVVYHGQPRLFVELMDERFGAGQWTNWTYNAIRGRVLDLGWTIEAAFDTPLRRYKRQSDLVA